MKKKKITLLSLLLVIMACIMPLTASARDAEQEMSLYPKIAQKITLLYCKNEPSLNKWYLDAITENPKGFFAPGIHAFSGATYSKEMYDITGTKTSNAKAAKIQAGLLMKSKNIYKGMVRITTLKPGKTTVFFRVNNYYDRKNMKYQDYKIEVTVKQVSNGPIKSLKIGKKDFTKKLKKEFEVCGNYPSNPSGKINVKVNSGWKLVKIRGEKFENNKMVYKTFKNGQNIEKDSVINRLEFIFQHTKTKVKVKYTLY